MSHSRFRCSILNIDMHGLIFETSICYWQDQPDNYSRYNAPWGEEPADRPLTTRSLSREIPLHLCAGSTPD